MKLTINGRELEVEPGTTVIRAAEKAGIFVPHYCYHAGLSIAGNCRMCLVEIEKMPKLAIACSTVAAEGMVVRTDSPKVKEAQDAILEFLLINHPLDCPICDQAGECRLQEFAFQFGPARSRFLEEKNHGPKSVDLGRHIVFDSERCILCSRCVRFCQEVSKTGELVISHRGDHATIETYPGMRLDNPYSGNTADICPVGALTLKEFRFQQRVWFLKDTPSVCAGCARGCNVLSGISKGRILRLTPRENQDVNRWWMCDEGRLSYTKLYGPSRIRWARVEGLTGAGAAGSLPTASEEGPVLPKMNEGVPPAPHPIGAMRPGETVMAAGLEAAAKALEAARTAGRVEFVFSPRATNEDIYALGKLAKELFGADRAALPSFERGEDDFLLIRKDKSPNRAGALAILGGLGLAVETGAELAGRIASGAVKAVVALGPNLMGLETADQAEFFEPLAVAAQAAGIPLVAIDAFESPLTARARIVLPALTYGELEGTFTNFEGRVQRVRSGVAPGADGLPVYRIAQELARRLGQPPARTGAQETFSALAAEVPAFGGLTYAKLGGKGAVIA
jgi:NADH-quinone oxidoreductase subunit G